MTAELAELDAHEQPAEDLKARWKRYTKAEKAEVDQNGAVISDYHEKSGILRIGEIEAEKLHNAFEILDIDASQLPTRVEAVPAYELKLVPGLIVVPNLLPPEVQWILMDRLVHRDLSDPRHLTNLHPHYHLPYPPQREDGSRGSFFSYPPDSTIEFAPKDPEIHNTLSIRQVLTKRLHWETLGGQYDWTSRVYPEERPPEFPADIARFLETIFPKTNPQAAIVNFYTPGDTMMMHRDVSEEVNKGLVSISLGCDALFMIAPNGVGKLAEDDKEAAEKQYLLLRLRSGDAIYMTGESRYAWHGVPKVIKGTCPEYLADWPAGNGKYEEWKGWMRNKRINLNVRQMKE